MNCGLCAEYCPFDAIKMDQNFELSNYERHQSHVYGLADLLVSSDYYARTHPEAYADPAEVAERAKVAKKKAARLAKGGSLLILSLIFEGERDLLPTTPESPL